MPVPEYPVSGWVRGWLRIEGLSVLVLACFFYWRQHASWTLFAVLFLAPDLAMLGYLAGSRIGAAAYNLAHSYVLPAAAAALAMMRGEGTVLASALIWMAHIGFDRALGYGLKYPSAFGHTHLGWVGRQKREESRV